MPPIKYYGCNKCGFSMKSGWGGYMYVEDNEGKRIICPHPGEDYTVTEVLGLKEDEFQLQFFKVFEEWWDERIGFNSYCLCLSCLRQFEADLRDEVSNEWRFFYKSPPLETLRKGIERLLSVNENCIPGDAWKKISKEWKKDERKCSSCGSNIVKTELELVGAPCPKCREGIIEEFSFGEVS